MLNSLTNPFKKAFLGGEIAAPAMIQNDPTTQGLMDQQAERALNYQAPRDTRLDGVDQRANLASAQTNLQEQNTALGMADNPQISKALANRANRAYEQDLNKLQTQVGTDPQQDMRGLNMLSRAHSNNLQQQQDTIQNIQALEAKRRAQIAARNSVVSQIVGLGAYGAGMAMGMPPVPPSAPQPAPVNTGRHIQGGGPQDLM